MNSCVHTHVGPNDTDIEAQSGRLLTCAAANANAIAQPRCPLTKTRIVSSVIFTLPVASESNVLQLHWNASGGVAGLHFVG